MEQSRKSKDKKAQYKLGSLYFKSKHPDAAANAFQLFKKSAKQGFTDAAYMLACCYHEGVVIRKNYQRAIKWYITAVNDVTYYGTIPATLIEKKERLFGNFWRTRNFQKKNDEVLDAKGEQMSIDNIINNALSGNPDARLLLGFYYYNGNEFEKDIQEAIFWYEKAAAQGNDAAMCHLAEHYNETGQYKESVEWYRKHTEERIKWSNKRLNW